MPNDVEIEQEIRKAWVSASLLCISLNIAVEDASVPSVDIILKENRNEVLEEVLLESHLGDSDNEGKYIIEYFFSRYIYIYIFI